MPTKNKEVFFHFFPSHLCPVHFTEHFMPGASTAAEAVLAVAATVDAGRQKAAIDEKTLPIVTDCQCPECNE